MMFLDGIDASGKEKKSYSRVEIQWSVLVGII